MPLAIAMKNKVMLAYINTFFEKLNELSVLRTWSDKIKTKAKQIDQAIAKILPRYDWRKKYKYLGSIIFYLKIIKTILFWN